MNLISEFRFTERWQHFRALWNNESYTDELLARLEQRDADLERYLLGSIAGGKVLTDWGIVRASSDLTATNAEQDIPGCTVDVPLVSGNLVRLRAVADVTSTSAGGVGVCRLSAAGSIQSQEAIFKGGVANDRSTVSQMWDYTAADDATKTFKLRGLYVGASGVRFNITHTSLSYEVFR